MELTVVVSYREASARYAIGREAEGLYVATLEHYDGVPTDSPPIHIVLIRGIRRWTGSFDHPDILAALGGAIDAHNVPKAAAPEDSIVSSES